MNNTRQLSQILQNTAQSRHLSPALRSSLSELSNKATVVCSNIAKDFEKHRDELVRSSTKVSRTSDQSKVPVAELTTCLKSADKNFTHHKDITRELQIHIHRQIGSCRAELQGNEADIARKRLQKEQNEEEIELLKKQITLHENEAKAKEYEASRLRTQAKEKEDQRDVHIVTGIVGTGLFAAGTILSGGAVAVVCAGAAAVNAGVNTTGAIICHDKMETLEREAREKRELAAEEKRKKNAKEAKTTELERDIKELRKHIAELKQAIESLIQVDKLLCTSVDQSEQFIEVVGGLCEAMKEAKNKTDTIKLIQDVIAKKPIHAKKMNVQRWMDDFKEKWEALESMLNMTDADTRGQISN